MQEELPSNSVLAIRQTQDGYLWLGTWHGLVRFDGINFELFTNEKFPQLQDNVIRALYQDQKGVLWIGTDSGGLTAFKDRKFTTYPISAHKALSRIRAIEKDQWGNLWIGSSTEGLTCLSKNKFTTYTTKEGLPHNEVRSIHKDGKGTLRAVTGAGIVKILKPGIFQPCLPENLFPYFITVCLYKEDKQELWIGTGGNGLFRLKDGIFTAYGSESGIPHLTITFLYEDRSKNLWIGTDGGLARMRDGVFSTLYAGDGLASGSIYSISEDREGTLWVGTINGGLYQLRDSKLTTYTTREGLCHDYIQSIYESRSGHLWIGTKGGLSRLTRDRKWPDGELKTILTSGQGLLTSDNFVVCIFEDPGGYLWIGTMAGLLRFKNETFTTFTKKEGLSGDIINCIYGDSKGNVWVGTEKGLNRFNENNDQFTAVSTKKGLSINGISFIFEDRRGKTWIGTEGSLNYLNDGIITPYKSNTRMETNFFRCAYEDTRGTLWFGTHNGLIRLRWQEKEARLYTYNVKCGLIENRVYSILEDERGYLWLAGPNGVSRVKKKELEDFSRGKIQRVNPDWFSEKDGMKSRWCTGIGCKTQDGRLWFSTNMGMTMIDPNRIRKNKLPPSIIIEKLMVDGESINIDAKALSGNPLELAPGKKRLEFYYTAVSFINPQRIRFKLKLVGYDNDWVDIGSSRTTNYTGIPPGHYTFQVIASNADGIWNSEGTSLSFYLEPYFHQTAWFYILVGLLVILMGFSLYRFRVRQLKKREKELSSLVKQRTSDLAKRTDELEVAHSKLRISKEIIEEKNRNIMSSIRYARNIQQAMLPMKEKMEMYLKDSFVIYLPKDIVSGDFYWFDIKEHYYFLAVADCTGHGVPGSLLSMIGYMMLDDVINERRILEPARILARLHQGFRYVLKQEIEKTDTYDGMDIGLYRFDLHSKKIIYAGARRPLFYVKNSQLIEVKGDRKSIGGRQKEKKHSFTNHQIDILDKEQDEIMLYLTTDGFADQQNPQNQKYGSRRLKKILKAIAHLSSDRQKEALMEEFKKHRAREEQRDDISIIGIRIYR